MKRLAIIIPCFNEEANIFYSSEKLIKILDHLIKENKISKDSYILYIDDGSDDNTWKNIKELSELYQTKIKGISLKKNLGHQIALTCGMFNADFDICITLDADLQDDIKKIHDMIDIYNKGYDIVLGVKTNNYENSIFMKILYNIFFFILSFLNPKIVPNHADFRLCSKGVVNWLKDNTNNNVLFIRGSIVNAPFKISKVKYKIKKRKYGFSKYSLIKSMKLARSGLFEPVRKTFFQFKRLKNNCKNTVFNIKETI